MPSDVTDPLMPAIDMQAFIEPRSVEWLVRHELINLASSVAVNDDDASDHLIFLVVHKWTRCNDADRACSQISAVLVDELLPDWTARLVYSVDDEQHSKINPKSVCRLRTSLED